MSDDVTTNHASESGRWLKLMADIEHEPEPVSFREPLDLRRRYDALTYQPPAGSLEP